MAFAMTPTQRSWSIWALYAVGLAPGIWTFYLGVTAQLGADPVRTFEHILGLWALRFLCLTLVVTPVRDLFKINLLPYRRALGLIAFWYVLAHFAVYLFLDRGLILSSIIGDLTKRPYIIIGMVCLILLIPLAATSNRWSIRRLGSRWATLHKLVYVVIAGAVLHYALSLKSITLEPAVYIMIVTVLLAYRPLRTRILDWRRQRKPLASART
ncbi:protein-methionine-sulfoxide reductase heme-binding subunit MsrQ [Ciceribacter sp. L1K23]|uniref:protein-methionine-sulfoxide reductase heme-binding subunit MsrQ n=1 Tax=Ciceribacter sp. L1K23 TaxID=2820276 RepID=UPI001B844585|nr:protein-methionine-sulfoxide reductase heme-binding subunit MsrQ [Ciceribacter sp. L1K23]MBR0555890.1 protein-methionine-sulfoxide reductase heme-binding subunit MsrQ [Ciceribacter sp. L1K23]